MLQYIYSALEYFHLYVYCENYGGPKGQNTEHDVYMFVFSLNVSQLSSPDQWLWLKVHI